MSEIALEFKPVDAEPTKAVAEAVTTSLKRAYTMSDSKKEQLVKARARALELRTAINAIKPPKVKPVKVKQPSKMEIEISEIKAAAAPTSPPAAQKAPEVAPKESEVAPKEPEPVAPKESPPVAHRAPEVPKLIKKLRLLSPPAAQRAPEPPPQKKEFQRDKVSGFFYL